MPVFGDGLLQWQNTPAANDQPSSRYFPDQVLEPEYPGHMQRRWVGKAGTLRFRQRRQLFLSPALVHERVALEEVDDGPWSIWFYEVLVGRLGRAAASDHGTINLTKYI